MRKLTRHVPSAARAILGIMFVVFGLNGFLNFIPMPAPEGAAAVFMGGLGAAGYFFPLLKLTEIAVGIMLLSARFVPLALTVLAPITLNILAFHVFVAPAGMALAVIVLVLHLYLAWAYRASFRAVLEPRARPVAGQHMERTPVTISA